jgi:hypothetical protein
MFFHVFTLNSLPGDNIRSAPPSHVSAFYSSRFSCQHPEAEPQVEGQHHKTPSKPTEFNWNPKNHNFQLEKFERSG